VVTRDGDHILTIEAFPYCIPDRQQRVEIEINDQAAGHYEFSDCDPVTREFPLAGDLLHHGWNELTLNFAYAVSPAEVTDGVNPDPRRLALGVTRLTIQPHQ
jgi:hypothetical protein